MATGIVTVVIAVAAAAALRSIYKQKKSGKSISCGGDCSHCALAELENCGHRDRKKTSLSDSEK